LVGAVENEEYLDGLREREREGERERERKEQKNRVNLIKTVLKLYTFYFILDSHGPLIDTWLLQEYMNCWESEKLSFVQGSYSQNHRVNLDRKMFFEVFL
jgi:hypothetical protein